MLYMTCPWCGRRAKSEFSAHGEAHIRRPMETDLMTDQEWGDYVFFQESPKGLFRERWRHDFGCRRWFNVVRRTDVDQTVSVYLCEGATVPPFPKHLTESEESEDDASET